MLSERVPHPASALVGSIPLAVNMFLKLFEAVLARPAGLASRLWQGPPSACLQSASFAVLHCSVCLYELKKLDNQLAARQVELRGYFYWEHPAST